MATEEPEESQSVKKIYTLPRELIVRIQAFQKQKKLPSEVEAVRRLLDEALLHRDKKTDVLKRVSTFLRAGFLPKEVVSQVLVGHPLVDQIRFDGPETVEFRFKDGSDFAIQDANILEFSHSSNEYEPYIPFA